MAIEESSEIKGLAEEVAALRARLSDLEAREEIRELFCRYGFTADTGDAKGWSEIYAPDGAYDGVSGRIEGRESFYRALEDPDGVHKRDIESKGSLHTTGFVMIGVDGDTAWAEGPTLVWVGAQDQQGWRVYSLSYNHWDLQKRQGRWEVTFRLSRPVAPENAKRVLNEWRAKS
jgi:hypothetical protein